MNDQLINNHFATYSTIIVWGFLTFMTMSFFFLVAILASRVLKTHRERKYAALRERLQRKLNIFVLHESGESNNAFPWRYHLDEFRGLIKTTYRKQLLINLLLANKKNLSGHSAATLRKIYLRLRLKRFSSLKLAHRNNRVKIEGLHELAEMECPDTMSVIQKLFYHRNKEVRQESFVAMVRLQGAAPFGLIQGYNGPITEWTQILLHKYLRARPTHQVPRFHYWLKSDNPAVRKFAISMIREFQQLEAATSLAFMMQDRDEELRALAIEALGDLGASAYSADLLLLGWHNLTNKELSLVIVRALGKIGQKELHQSFLSWHVSHGSLAVRWEALRSLLSLRASLTDFNLDDNPELKHIYHHLTHPLLQ